MGLTYASRGKYGQNMFLGLDRDDSRPVFFEGDTCLATIAPQGSGKTECHVMPNIMAWPGAAIILDVTGALWHRTSDARSKYGPVYKIDLDDIDSSDRYNPFDAIRRDPRYVWDDAKEFAQLVFLKDKHQAFFASTGGQFLTATICYVAMYYPDETRNFDTLRRILSGGTLKEFITQAETRTEIPSLVDAAAMARTANPETFANVQYTAKSTLEAWDGYQASTISRISDWHPQDLRRSNGTVYLRISVQKLEDHAGFARLIIGQHINALMRGVPDRTNPWLQIFLDEAPKLGSMKPIRDAIEVGRNYNLRVWLFMQFISQFEEAHGRVAKGLLGSCGVQMFMNPQFMDGTAEMLSKALGTVENRLQGTRKARVEPSVLTGPKFAEDILTFPNSEAPQRLRKFYFYQNARLRALEGAAP